MDKNKKARKKDKNLISGWASNKRVGWIFFIEFNKRVGTITAGRLESFLKINKQPYLFIREVRVGC